MEREKVLELHRAHMAGETLAMIGERIGRSHESVRLLFKRHDLPVGSRGQRSIANRAEKTRLAEEKREDIITLYKRHGAIDPILPVVGLPREYVAKVVRTIPDRERYRRRRASEVYSREDLLGHLHQAHRWCHPDDPDAPLTMPGYREASKVLGLASFDTQLKHFWLDNPEEPWLAALAAAGIPANPPRGRRAGAITFDQCVSSVAECLREYGGDGGGRVSYAAYSAWASRHRRISGISVRKICGWNLAVELALDKLAGHDITKS